MLSSRPARSQSKAAARVALTQLTAPAASGVQLPPTPTQQSILAQTLQSLQSQLSSLELDHRANHTRLKSLHSQLLAADSHQSSLLDYLSAEENRKQNAVRRIQQHIESIKQQQQKDRQSMLASFESSLSYSHALYTEQQSKQVDKHMKMKDEIESMAAVVRERQAMEQQLASLKQQIIDDEARRVSELASIKARVARERDELVRHVDSIKPHARVTRDDNYRRTVVRQIEQEKSLLMSEWESLRHERRVRHETIEELKKSNLLLTQRLRSANQSRELNEGEIDEMKLLYEKRNSKYLQTDKIKLLAEDELAKTIIQQQTDVVQPIIDSQQLLSLQSQVADERSRVESQQKQEKLLRQRGLKLLSERQEAEQLMLALIRDLHEERRQADNDDEIAEECKSQSSQRVPSSLSPSSTVYLSDLDFDQREKLLRILLFRLNRHKVSRELTRVVTAPDIPTAGDSDDYESSDTFVTTSAGAMESNRAIADLAAVRAPTAPAPARASGVDKRNAPIDSRSSVTA